MVATTVLLNEVLRVPVCLRMGWMPCSTGRPVLWLCPSLVIACPPQRWHSFATPPRRLTPTVGFLGARWSYCGALQQDRCRVTKRMPE
jgi:hypothetical protein